MKAVIIAAGRGNRLMPETDNKPKCLLKVGGKTIMERALEVFRECGVKDVVVVRGYRGDLIDYTGVKYYENTDYDNNNILRSLFYAEDEIDGEFIFSYSDILYKKDVVEKLLQSQTDISLIVDTDWLTHYEGRYQHPIAEAELVTVENNRVTKIGKDVALPEDAHGEFIGLAKFSKEGAEILRSNYRRIAKRYHDKPFQRAASLEKAYLTDMIQELIDRGYVVTSVDIKGGWAEIDTPQDLRRAQERWIR
jgi:phosphoenolpyruvate phosphomutase